jgi:hypothetical protein
MSNQKDLKTKVFVQKLINDRDEQFFKTQRSNFALYSNGELFKYLDTDYKALINILEDLKSQGVIFQYECLDTEAEVKKSKKEGLEGYRITGFPVGQAPKYEECLIKLPEGFLDKAQSYLAGQSDKAGATSVSGLTLYYNDSGDLWHIDGEKNRYEMGQGSARFFIFRYLVDNKGYQTTPSITLAINLKFSKKKTSHNVRSEISKIRNNIKESLGIDRKDFIQSRKGNGYRINPNYQVIPVK